MTTYATTFTVSCTGCGDTGGAEQQPVGAATGDVPEPYQDYAGDRQPRDRTTLPGRLDADLQPVSGTRVTGRVPPARKAKVDAPYDDWVAGDFLGRIATCPKSL